MWLINSRQEGAVSDFYRSYGLSAGWVISKNIGSTGGVPQGDKSPTGLRTYEGKSNSPCFVRIWIVGFDFFLTAVRKLYAKNSWPMTGCGLTLAMAWIGWRRQDRLRCPVVEARRWTGSSVDSWLHLVKETAFFVCPSSTVIKGLHSVNRERDDKRDTLARGGWSPGGRTRLNTFFVVLDRAVGK